MKSVFAFLVLGLVGAIAWPEIRVRHLATFFERIKVGSIQDFVIEQMGKPWQEGECGVYLGAKSPGCTEEFVCPSIRTLYAAILDHRV